MTRIFGQRITCFGGGGGGGEERGERILISIGNHMRPSTIKD